MRPILLLLLLCAVAPIGFAAAEYPKQGEDIYDVKADGKALIAAALEKARANHKRVLLDFGANWCVWCHRLHATFTDNERVAAFLRRHFVVVMIDVNPRDGKKRNSAVNEQYGNPIQHGLPVLVVLDASGRLLATQETGALEEGGGHSPEKIIAFLSQWTPPPLN